MSDDNGEEILGEILAAQEMEEFAEQLHNALKAPLPTKPGEEGEQPTSSRNNGDSHCQWALGGNGRYQPVGATVPRLPSGIYEPFATNSMWGLEKMHMSSDGIYMLPDMATEDVLDEVKRFWENEERYRKHKLLYKRGIILWGPPGGGKTVTVKLLMNELVKRDGIVVLAQNINLTTMCLKAIRRIEPKRNLIVVLEDIDEILNFNGESVVLSLLDGENNVDNVLHLATTNYPERLGARIINRPSRFDRRVYVGMPSSEARKAYLLQATNNGLTEEDITKWLEDTDKMSVAHLRELVAAVYCLDQPYDEVIKRLQDMAKQVKGEEEFKKNRLGFGGRQKVHVQPLEDPGADSN